MPKGMYFTPPTDAQLEDIVSTPEMREAMETGAEALLEFAQANAPVATGAYRDSFRVEPSPDTGTAEAYLVNDDQGALAIEEDHHTLAQAVDRLESGAE